MQMRSQCFYSVVMTNSKLDWTRNWWNLSLSVIIFSFSFYDFFAFINFYVFYFCCKIIKLAPGHTPALNPNISAWTMPL